MANKPDTRDPQRGAVGASRDDAISISSDDESDHGDLDDGQSDTSFPLTDEPVQPRRKGVESGGVAGKDNGLNATPSAGDDADAKERSVADGAGPDNESASCQQQTRGLERSASPKALPAGRASELEGTTCDKTAEEISRTIPLRVEAQRLPSPGRLTTLSRPESSHRPSTPHRDSASESISEPPVNPKSSRRRAALDAPRVDSDDKDEAESVRQSDGHLGPRKRRKMSSPTRPNRLRTATGRQVCSDGGASRSRQVRTSTPGQKRSCRRGGKGTAEAKFEEWPLEHAVLKRVTTNGSVIFQVQFSWDPCANHGREDYATRNRRYKPAKRHPSGTATRVAFTPEEDDLLFALKQQELSWQQIHKQFTEAFPQRGRGVGTLRVRYSTKLKGSNRVREAEQAPSPMDSDEYEVERILEVCLDDDGELQYRAKWVGYDDDDQKWYPAANFKNSPQKLLDCHRDNPLGPAPPKRLSYWMQCWEEDRDANEHPDDNKPETRCRRKCT